MVRCSPDATSTAYESIRWETSGRGAARWTDISSNHTGAASRFLRDDLPADVRADYERRVGNFTQVQREGFLIGMIKVGFLKRMESVLDSGDVRFGFVHPKQILTIYRELCAGKSAPYELLCNVFDQLTHNGSDMTAYDRLLQPAVDSIVATFRKRVAAGLQGGRSFVIPNQREQASEKTDFKLVTWLVVVTGGANA